MEYFAHSLLGLALIAVFIAFLREVGKVEKCKGEVKSLTGTNEQIIISHRNMMRERDDFRTLLENNYCIDTQFRYVAKDGWSTQSLSTAVERAELEAKIEKFKLKASIEDVILAEAKKSELPKSSTGYRFESWRDEA
jgi:hypothetical protein